MPDGTDRLVIRTADDIADIGAADWDRCAGTAGGAGNPFVSYDFLHALEETGCCNAESGWLPQHLVLEDPDGSVRGVVPAYLKNHSYGEYVFDWGWGDAYERAGGRYYPKLQISVPFSPVTGPRLLAPAGPEQVRDRLLLINGLIRVCEKLGISNFHVTFPTEEEARLMAGAGLMLRHGQQYHWHNQGYESFDDFLGALMSRKRKAIRRERREVAESGIRVRTLTGGEIKGEHWDHFHQFYVDTYDRKWGYPYLTRGFFEALGDRMADRVALVVADIEGVMVAGALNLISDEALIGRNWGAAGDFRFLHFEACYYQAIDFAIAHGLSRVEAGTQGPHKVQRGYLPSPTWSAHWVASSGFQSAIEKFLDEERRAIDREMAMWMRHSPYRSTEHDRPAPGPAPGEDP